MVQNASVYVPGSTWQLSKPGCCLCAYKLSFPFAFLTSEGVSRNWNSEQGTQGNGLSVRQGSSSMPQFTHLYVQVDKILLLQGSIVRTEACKVFAHFWMSSAIENTFLDSIHSQCSSFFSDDRPLHNGSGPKISLVAERTWLCTTWLAGPGVVYAPEKLYAIQFTICVFSLLNFQLAQGTAKLSRVTQTRSCALHQEPLKLNFQQNVWISQ